MDDIGVYLIEINSKKYVGSTTVGFNRRWNDHLRALIKGIHCNKHLQRAYNKYGKDSLKFSILETVQIKEECIHIEQKYIDKLKPEYNIYSIAGSPLGIKPSEKTRQKMGESRKGRKHTEETKKKMSEDRKLAWKTASEETKNKRRISSMGHIFSEESKKKMSESAKKRDFGYLHTKEVRQKAGNSRAGQSVSEEIKKKISQAHTGKKLTEEAKRKMSITRTGRIASEKTKQNMSDAQKLSWKRRRDVIETSSISISINPRCP